MSWRQGAASPDDPALADCWAKRRRKVIPEGAGFCQPVSDQWFWCLSASSRAAPGEGPGSRRSARSVARTNGLDAGPARRMLVGGCRKISGEIVVVGLLQAVMAQIRWGRAGLVRLPVIPSPS